MPLPNEINLTPSTQFAKSNVLDKLYIWGSTAGKLIIIITNFIIISVWLYRWNLDRQIYNISTSIQEKQLAITSINKKEETIRKVQTKLQILRKIETDKSNYSNLLNNINDTIIVGVTLNQITFPSNKIASMSVTATSGEKFGQYIDKLIKDNKVKNVILYGSSLNSTDNSYEFAIEIQYK